MVFFSGFFQIFLDFFQKFSKIGLGFNISAEIDDLEKEIDWSWDWIGGITDGPITDFDMENEKLLIADTGAAQVKQIRKYRLQHLETDDINFEKL